MRKRRLAAPLLSLPLLLMGSGVARADATTIAICTTLDDYPTVSGVMGIAKAMFEQGYSAYDAGLLFREAVDEVCPEHRALVFRVVNAMS